MRCPCAAQPAGQRMGSARAAHGQRNCSAALVFALPLLCSRRCCFCAVALYISDFARGLPCHCDCPALPRMLALTCSLPCPFAGLALALALAVASLLPLRCPILAAVVVAVAVVAGAVAVISRRRRCRVVRGRQLLTKSDQSVRHRKLGFFRTRFSGSFAL